MTITERIKGLRNKTGKSQGEFAASIGLQRANYARIEGGHQNPTIETLSEIVRNYCNDYPHVTYEWLIEGKKSKKEQPQQVNEPSNVYVTKEVVNLPQIVTVDSSGKENTLLVPTRARAGYLNGYGDREFIAHLPAYRLPGMTNGTFRMFEVEGMSMNPTLNDRDILVTQFVEKLEQIRDERVYVILTKTDGIVVKRVFKRLKEQKLLLKSDNYNYREEYPTLIVDVEDILEVWYGVALFTKQFRPPSELSTKIADMEGRLTMLESAIKVTAKR